MMLLCLLAGGFSIPVALCCICGIGLGTMCTTPRYSGKISWKGTTPIDGCVAAKCTVKSSNMLAGSKCACKDG